MKSNKAKQHKKKPNLQKARKIHNPRQNKAVVSKPTLVLRAHTLIAQNVTGVNIKQINIAPSLQVFGGDVLAQARYFQSYRITNVSVTFLGLNPVNTYQGTQNL